MIKFNCLLYAKMAEKQELAPESLPCVMVAVNYRDYTADYIWTEYYYLVYENHKVNVYEEDEFHARFNDIELFPGGNKPYEDDFFVSSESSVQDQDLGSFLKEKKLNFFRTFISCLSKRYRNL